MDKITIQNLEVYAKHGVFPEENFLGQKFLISAALYMNTRKAGLSDDLEDSVNYGEVCHFIKQYMEEHTYKLIERVTEQLACEILLHFPLVKGVDVEVKKPWAPIGLPLDTVSISISRKWHTAYIALGSNLGDRDNYLDEAVDKLKTHPLCRVIKVADYLETEPYGGVEQGKFINSALELQTLLDPEELLDALHVIENEAGRKRTIHWGPRTLDLDILLYDNEIIETEDLCVPHIEMHLRDFVLIPMAQIAPYKRHPVSGKTMKELKEQL